MAYAWNGWGTKYYGDWPVTHEGKKCKIMTEFIIAMWIPVFPVESVVVLSETKKHDMLIYNSKELRIVNIGIFLPQIFNIYSIFVAVIAAFLILFWVNNGSMSLLYGVITHAVLMVFPVFSIYYTRKYCDGMKITKISKIATIMLIISFIVNVLFLAG